MVISLLEAVLLTTASKEGGSPPSLPYKELGRQQCTHPPGCSVQSCGELLSTLLIIIIVVVVAAATVPERSRYHSMGESLQYSHISIKGTTINTLQMSKLVCRTLVFQDGHMSFISFAEFQRYLEKCCVLAICKKIYVNKHCFVNQTSLWTHKNICYCLKWEG